MPYRDKPCYQLIPNHDCVSCGEGLWTVYVERLYLCYKCILSVFDYSHLWKITFPVRLMIKDGSVVLEQHHLHEASNYSRINSSSRDKMR